MEYLNFNGKKYLIFGASSGIGKQVALQLSQLGARLVLVGRNEEKLQETLEMLDGDGHNILICDVSDFSAAQNAVKTAVSMDNIKLDGCVFSAGIYAMLPLGAVTEEKINKIFATNIVSMMAIAKAFSSKRISNNGASFVKEMSNRLIRFNAVCPEAVDTEMGAGFKDNTTQEAMQKIYPLGMLEAEDVADTIIFLLSDMSKKITGQSIWLSAGNDGGSIDGHIL